ncbi:MAG TPA: hypothetical protein PKW95_14995 [bacterium]|nr:hypothetical protein [bacterium]
MTESTCSNSKLNLVEESHKIDIILNVAGQVFNESVRYSSMIWKHSLMYATILFGVVVFAKGEKLPLDRNSVLYSIIGFLVVAYVWCITMLIYCLKNIIKNRKILAKCRESLKLFDEGFYLHCVSIIPRAWQTKMVSIPLFSMHCIAVTLSCFFAVLLLIKAA